MNWVEIIRESVAEGAELYEELVIWDTEPLPSENVLIKLSLVSDITENDRAELVNPETLAITNVVDSLTTIQIFAESDEAGEGIAIANNLRAWFSSRSVRRDLLSKGVALEGPPSYVRPLPFERDGYAISAATFEITFRSRREWSAGDTKDRALHVKIIGNNDVLVEV